MGGVRVLLGDRDPECVYSRRRRATGEKGKSKYTMDEILENGGQGSLVVAKKRGLQREEEKQRD